jgi:TOBE domain
VTASIGEAEAGRLAERRERQGTRHEYQGTWVKITLEGASDEEFVVNVPDTEFFVDPINTGDMVRAHWKGADVHPLVGSSRSDRPHASGQN